MALKIFNKLTAPSRTSRSDIASMSINFSSSTFLFSACAVKTLKLTDKSMIQFAQDDEKPSVWYLALVSENGFHGKSTKNGYRISNKVIARAVIESIKPGEGIKGVRFLISEKTVKMGGISWYSLTLDSAL